MSTRCGVTCYSGDSYAQRPRRFIWQGEMNVVDAVIKEGYTPQGKQFLVQTPDGLWFTLAYSIEFDQWQVSESCQPVTPRRSF